MKVVNLLTLTELFNNNLLQKSLEYNPLFSLENIEYQKYYRTDIISSENISFAIKNQDLKFLYVFVAFRHTTKSGLEFSNYGLPIITLENEISPSTKKIITTEIINRIDFSSNILYSQFNFEILDIFSELLFVQYKRPILQFESKVNLLLDYNIIRQSFRKSYKSLISKFSKQIDLRIYNSRNINIDVYNEFKKLHLNEAGRMTRSEKTWELHFDMIKDSYAILICAEFEDKLIGAALFIHSRFSAYYGVSASDLILKKTFPITHLIIDKAIHYYKDLGLLKLILGRYEPDSSDEKLKGISSFKSAFSNEKSVIINFQ
ncbi:hypothetical protein [Flavobacterium sp.]|uniref:hypothetical protein n=1 Tax=Flavobacterium sp. TaxID=239 RepID=UPI0040484EEE